MITRAQLLLRTLPARMRRRTANLLARAQFLLRTLPARLELEHLRWALREMDALHPELPLALRRARELEDDLV